MSDVTTCVTATLEDWGWYVPGVSVVGAIHGDEKRRWADGTRVHASRVLSLSTDEPAEGTVVTTRNSVYRLGKPAVDA